MDKLLEAKTYIRRLKALGMSKYAIARHCRVHWNTVRKWETGEFKAGEQNRRALDELVKMKGEEEKKCQM